MAIPRPLARPPIVEALIDIKAPASAGIDEKSYGFLREQLRETYPDQKERKDFGGELQLEGNAPQFRTWDTQFRGMLFKSADGLSVAQFRLDGFTLNCLAPYGSGDALIAEAARLWPLHVELARPAQVTRIGLRYINRFAIPLAEGEPSDSYLTSPPPAVSGLPNTLAEFLTRMVLVDKHAAVNAIVTQQLQRAGQQPQVTIDVDVFRPGPFGIAVDELLEHLSAMRAYKNKVFFSLLTDQALARFE